MKVKEVERTANIAWSPAEQFPIYMAAGTAAQQLDATFSTSAALEVYSLNLTDVSLNMPLVASLDSDCRFHKVLWGCHGMSNAATPSGVIVAGTDNGSILTYNANALIKGQKDTILFKQDKHTGAVKALDFNPYQPNLLASGASESEIYIWDLNKSESPMTPGAKSQPPEEVACVSWNKQVQHILASTFTARCVVWDLRKNEPIIKISDSMARIKSKLVAWHPEVATQMALSSEDDHTPVIQIWDLRYATSPVKVLENHQRGILSMAWCPQDPDLLMTCGKDNRILCWNPNSPVQGGEVVYELPISNQWSFDVQWCPRNPAIISSSSFDGHVTVFSLMGGGSPIQHTDKIADSFSTNDPFAQTSASQVQQTQNFMPLQKPPRWLRKPVGASFGFGGKLVSFENSKPAHPQEPVQHRVTLSQVVTETDLLNRSMQLEQALSKDQYLEFCAMKAANSADVMQENIWNFLRVNFEKEPRERYIQLLGYDKTDLAKKVMQHVGSDSEALALGVDAQELAQKMSLLDTGGAQNIGGLFGSGQASPSVGSKTPVSTEDASDGSSAFDEIAAHAQQHHSQMRPQSPLVIPTTDDAEGLLGQALLSGSLEAAVEMCLCENKMAEAILLAVAGGPELLSRTQKKYFQKNNSCLGRLISSVVTHDWVHVVETCDLSNWKEALAIILTYATPEEFVSLCDSLAARLETERDGEFSMYASLCYICSGSVEKLVENWHHNTDANNSSLALQDLVEKVMILRKAVELSRGQAPEITSGMLADKLSSYAGILAAQGTLDTAMRYLGNSNEISLSVLRDRLFRSSGQTVPGMQTPPFPFQPVNIVAEGANPQPQVSQHRPSEAPTVHQAQARSGFQTVTTASATYLNQAQYTTMNGPSSQGAYNPVAVAAQPIGAPVSPTSKSSRQRYPSNPQASSLYGIGTYSQDSYMQPDYSQQHAYQQTNYYGSGYEMAGAQTNPQHAGVYNPISSSGVPQASSGQPAASSFMDHRPAEAWNDPPMVRERSRSQPSDQNPPGAPIDYSNLYNPQEHQQPLQQPRVPQVPMQTNLHSSQIPEAPKHPQQQYSHSEPEPPKQVVKGPIPANNKILQDIFDSLVINCQSAANNAQMKRKLEDVVRKLEVLYDRLRQNNLSDTVILGLHQIVQAMQQGDYNTGLQVYTQMVSHGNFSEISSFMPGLKVLIQSAMQLRVYVQ